jgi:hypothetical protein
MPSFTSKVVQRETRLAPESPKFERVSRRNREHFRQRAQAKGSWYQTRMSQTATLQDRVDGAIASRIDRWARSWRGPAVAALIAFLAGLPGLFTVPPLDRDESRFAQASAQMLETRDFTSINFQDAPRSKKPVGIHWLQAISVSLVSAAEDRQIWAFRIPACSAPCWPPRPAPGEPAPLSEPAPA